MPATPSLPSSVHVTVSHTCCVSELVGGCENGGEEGGGLSVAVCRGEPGVHGVAAGAIARFKDECRTHAAWERFEGKAGGGWRRRRRTTGGKRQRHVKSTVDKP